MGNADIHRGADTNALIAPRVITGAINGPAFDTCIETQPAPALDPGTVVILDNLSTHKVHPPPAAEALRQSASATDRSRNLRRLVRGTWQYTWQYL